MKIDIDKLLNDGIAQITNQANEEFLKEKWLIKVSIIETMASPKKAEALAQECEACIETMKLCNQKKAPYADSLATHMEELEERGINTAAVRSVVCEMTKNGPSLFAKADAFTAKYNRVMGIKK